MKYYIFAGNTPVIKSTIKKAKYSSTKLRVIIDRFDIMINQGAYNHCYLIVDFESNKKIPVFGALDIARDEDKQMPFFIIGEWHIGQDQSDYIRTDLIQIVKNGFVHEFDNNYDAMREIEFCIENKTWFVMSILYSRVERRGNIKLNRTFVRQICDMSEYIERRRKNLKPLKKIIIRDEYNWFPLPKTERKFFNYDLKKNTSNVV